MNCDQILETIASYMIERMFGKTGTHIPDHALQHLLLCPACREQMDVMVHIMTGSDLRFSRPLTCEEVMDLTSEMVETEESQVPYGFPAAWLHLVSCPDCRDVYEMTRATLTPDNEMAFERVRQSALPFKLARQEIWQKISPLVQKLSVELIVLVRRGKDAFVLIPEWLATTVLIPIPAMTYRSDSVKEGFIQDITIPDLENDQQLVIRVKDLEDNNLQIHVRIVDKVCKRSIGGVSVALFDQQGRYLMQIVTPEILGDNGGVYFDGCQLGRYTLRVSENEKVWEVALNLA